jgi:hypothetical protein
MRNMTKENILPENLSVVMIRYRTRQGSIHVGLERKIKLAIAEQNPDLIITPLRSFPNMDYMQIRCSSLVKKNSAVAIQTGFEAGLFLTPPGMVEDHIFEKFLSETIVEEPYVVVADKEEDKLAFLINLSEDNGGLKNEFVNSLKPGGYYLMCNRTRRNIVIRKTDDVRVIGINPQQHKNQDKYDWYLLPISAELLRKELKSAYK